MYTYIPFWFPLPFLVLQLKIWNIIYLATLIVTIVAVELDILSRHSLGICNSK